MVPLLLLLSIGAAPADEPAVRQQTFTPRPFVGWPLLELRGGVDSMSEGRAPMICMEIGAWTYLAVEACGSGAGILHDQDIAEMVHFRLEGTIPVVRQGRFELVVQPGLGFAEVQTGRDEGGFLFGPARTDDQNEGAGPEATASAKSRVWFHERAYGTAELSTGVAWIESAPTVLGGSTIVPSVTFTLGLGF